ncbi:T9SS type A sorting domain-containing protein [Aquimarina sp. ERC-38]|uniref:T9SS type A sorting domain-containing protein n=1 Tax=Aquimarina sp. ERC-38 TaxID=2949996 RepID=UPI002245A8D3|nr:T9SS type A sorting domain-containing protein [Aquimarina sp. ERC-38]UZO80233.1 T9SS type A sorting domain-containing protein [Aquimarina sp. ERC-38]
MFPKHFKKALLSTLVIIAMSLYMTEANAQKIYASSFGFNKSDATEAFRAAMYAKADTVVIDRQAGPWYIKPTRLFDVSDKVIIFEKGVIIQSKKGEYSSRNAKLIDLLRPKNLEILGYGAELRMNRSELPKSPSSSQGRHALTIGVGDNIKVKGLSIKDAMGDGIYIGGSGKNDSKSYSKNILLEDIFVENSYRQAITLISVENFTAKFCRFIKSNGALPEAGLDIEPNYNFERIVNVNFEDCRFMDNNHSGIKIAVVNLDGSSEPISVNFKDCYLYNNHSPSNKYAATEIHLGTSKDKSYPVKGEVMFERLMIENSNWGALYSRKPSNSYFVTFKDCVFKDICKNGDKSPIYLEVQDYSNTSPFLGGYKFENVVIDYKSNTEAFVVFGHKTLKGVSNISGNINIIHPDLKKGLYLREVKKQENLSLKINNLNAYPKTSLSVSATVPNAIEKTESSGYYTFTRSGGDINLPLALKYSYSGRVSTRLDMQYIGIHKIIPSNTPSAKLYINPIKDTYEEGIENFRITLKSSNHYDREDSKGTATSYILDEKTLAPIATDDYIKIDSGETKKSINVIKNDNKGGSIDPDSLALIDPMDSSNHLQEYFDPNTGRWSVNKKDSTITFSPCSSGDKNCNKTFSSGKATIRYYIEDQTNTENTSAEVTFSRENTIIPDPLPIARDDTFLFTPGVPEELYILANDQSGDAIDHSTLKLIRDIPGGTKEVEEIDIPNQGLWAIDYDNDFVVFTPKLEDVVLENFKLKYSVKDFQGNTTYGYMIFSKKKIIIDKLPISYDDYGNIIPNDISEINVVDNDVDGDEVVVSTLKIFNEDSETSEGVYTDNLLIENIGEWKVNTTDGSISFLPFDLEKIEGEEITIQYAIEDPQGNKSYATVHWLKKNTVASTIVAVDDMDTYTPGEITNLKILDNDENIELADLSTLHLLDEEGNEIKQLHYEDATWSVNEDEYSIVFDPCGSESNTCSNSFSKEKAEVLYSIKDKNGIPVTAKIVLERKNNLSVTKVENYIYPNPNSGSFEIVMKEDVSDAIITVTDLTGKTIIKQQNLSGHTFKVDLVDNLSKGLYIANVKTNGIINSIKFIIN